MAGKAGDWRAWTDREYGFIADHSDWTNRQLAEALDRTPNGVGMKRRALATGWSPVDTRESWSDDEDAFIRATPHLTAAQVAEALGRTTSAINHRRADIRVRASVKASSRANLGGFHGFKHSWGPNTNPHRVGARPLVARTCPKCGLLLSAKWYLLQGKSKKRGGDHWSALCRKCKSENAPRRYAESTEANRKAARKSFDAQQARTLPLAEKAGQPYTLADHAVLSDPDLTNFEKAITLKRTYSAVVGAVQVNRYRSRRGLGKIEDRWIIDNPNEPKKRLKTA